MASRPIVTVEAKLLERRFPWECRTPHPYESVVPWCEAQFGEFNDRWYRYGSDIAQGIVAGVPLHDYYRFRDEQAAILFRLKWS
jgi:hypothetical protein